MILRSLITMPPSFYIAATCFLIVLLGILYELAAWQRRKAYRNGKRDGYVEGYSDAEKHSELWWVVADQEVYEARKKVWRSEPKKGMWP